MGFFSSLLNIGSKIAGVLAAPATGGASLWATLGSTALDVGSTLYANKQERDAASTAYGRSMSASNTSYQRAVADMRAAGLNPILAYSQGGASSPTAGTAQVSTAPPMGQRGIQNAATKVSMMNTMANTALSAEQVKREELMNDGLRALPPQIRALGQMSNNTASAAVAAAYLANKKFNTPDPPSRPRTDAEMPSWALKAEKADPRLKRYRRGVPK